jgi:ribosomal protein S27E
MLKSTRPRKGDYLQSVVYITIYLVLIGGGAFLLLPQWWLWWGLLVVVGIVLLVGWHRAMTVYQCPNCEHVYEISFWTDLISPHGVDKKGGWLYLRCPDCRQRNKTRVLKRVD